MGEEPIPAVITSGSTSLDIDVAQSLHDGGLRARFGVVAQGFGPSEVSNPDGSHARLWARVKLSEVFVSVVAPGRTPLRQRQRASGSMGSIPLTARQTTPYGLLPSRFDSNF
jgi:hypothetical protein